MMMAVRLRPSASPPVPRLACRDGVLSIKPRIQHCAVLQAGSWPVLLLAWITAASASEGRQDHGSRASSGARPELSSMVGLPCYHHHGILRPERKREGKGMLLQDNLERGLAQH